MSCRQESAKIHFFLEFFCIQGYVNTTPGAATTMREISRPAVPNPTSTEGKAQHNLVQGGPGPQRVGQSYIKKRTNWQMQIRREKEDARGSERFGRVRAETGDSDCDCEFKVVRACSLGDRHQVCQTLWLCWTYIMKDARKLERQSCRILLLNDRTCCFVQ